MIYGTDRAADKLKMSRRNLMRLASRLGIRPALLGSRIRMVFSDRDLEAIRKLKKR